jgi:hypothetical protein
MQRRFAWSMALIWGLAACHGDSQNARASVDLTAIKAIHIDYQYMGWGSLEEKFVIVPTGAGGAFVLRGHYSAQRGTQFEIEDEVSPQLVQTFLDEAQAPAWSRSEGIYALMQRIDRGALRRAEPDHTIPPSRCTRSELQQLAKLHVRRRRVIGLVDDYYGQGISWTDDYPFAVVQIHRHDGSIRVMSSRSQKAMMLPWDSGLPTDWPRPSGENWSLPLSRSLQALLPPSSRMYERLDGIARMQKQVESQAKHEASRLCDEMRPEQRPE